MKLGLIKKIVKKEPSLINKQEFQKKVQEVNSTPMKPRIKIATNQVKKKS